MVEWTALHGFSVVRGVLAVGLATLIVVHGFWSTEFKIDTTSLGLIGLLLVVLVLPEIEEFEAFGVKFKRRLLDVEARTAAEATAALPPTPAVQPLLNELRQVPPPTTDAVGIALNARTTLLAAVRRLHSLVALTPTSGSTDGQILAELLARRYVTPAQSEVFKDVIRLANDAAHGGRVSDDEALRLNAAARSLAETITSNSPRAFEAEVGRILESTGLVVDFLMLSPARDVGADYRVQTARGWILVNVKFWTRPGVGAFPFVTRAEHDRARERPVYFVVPNIEIDVQRLELPPHARIVTIANLARLAARGTEAFDEVPE